MTEYIKFFGLQEDFNGDDLKKAYRKLSFKYHPDRNRDSLQSHLAMIKINKAYSELTGASLSPGSATTKSTRDKSYEIYKEGIALFQAIHPSKWKKNLKKSIDNPHAVESDENTPEIIKGLIDSMARAYYQFSLIVTEYPESCWYTDSQVKIGELEKMTVRYMKILDSYKKEEK